MTSEELINDLIDRTKKNFHDAEKLNQHSFDELNRKMDAKSWSALECLEHLNMYGDFYLDEIETRMESSRFEAEVNFKAGFIGDYFAKSMLPKEKLNKMKTFKDKNPDGSNLDKSTIDRFVSQQNRMLSLLDKSRGLSLNKTKTAISISKLIKLKLGDTFRVVIYHNQRHLKQAMKAAENDKGVG